MSFKLLAIRPLEGTDLKLLKGLKENCFYRFYNEYEYFNGSDENVNDKKFKNIITIDEKEIFTGYEHQPVVKIEYCRKVPNNFYGENINVSAIVGENGSGKSSLLELLYAFIYNQSVFTRLIHKEIEQDNITVTSIEYGRRVIKGVKQITVPNSLQNLDKLIGCNIELYLLEGDDIVCVSAMQIKRYKKNVEGEYNLKEIQADSRLIDKILSVIFYNNKINKSYISFLEGEPTLLTNSNSLEDLIKSFQEIKKTNDLKNVGVERKDEPINELNKGRHLLKLDQEFEVLSRIFLSSTKSKEEGVNKYLQFLFDNKKTIIFKNDIDEYLLKFYTIVLNYSIYGFNSEVMGSWLDKLFHKNDGYQTPIVVNPYRSEGNIDINNEYLLAQSRLLLNHFVIKNNRLLDNITVKNINFQLDYLKHQYLKNQYNVITEQVVREDKNFLNILSKDNIYILDSVYKLREGAVGHSVYDVLLFFDIPQESVKNIEFIYKEGVFLYKVNKEEKLREVENYFLRELAGYNGLKEELKDNSCNHNRYFSEVKPLMIINIIYIFKKIYKIIHNYKEYQTFRQLYRASSSSNINISNSEIFEITLIKELNKTNTIGLNTIITKENRNELEEIVRNAKDRINEDFDELINAKPHLRIVALVKCFDEVIESFENYLIKEGETLNDILKSIRKPIDLSFNEALYVLFKKLEIDTSHVTFKLKQAINYLKSDFFFKIEDIKEIKDSYVLSLSIKQEYFDNLISENKKIKDVEIPEDIIYNLPLAMIQPNIQVSKKEGGNSVQDHDFRSLSSGEQQMIHSLLTIVYHIYNLKSVVSGQTYKEVNLIFDEIELYFHPEYQRTFISNLLSSLKTINETNEFKFNIVLSTHSPFILSDIPSQNVLKLKEGVPVSHDSINSFGSNIHDLLADEFFLKNGFMGEFAANKINEIFSRIEKLKGGTDETYILLFNEINLIGEKVLREPLLNLLDKRMKESTSNKENLIKRYKGILNKLEEEL